jgi:PIN domain nuclease of toxin-antitoxin system
VQHARVAGGFPADHRDPFDRIIAAQSQVEGLTLVTNDPAFAGFPVKTLW